MTVSKTDIVHAKLARFRGKVERALMAIDYFLRKNPCAYVGTSWGKDSVVTADLVLRVDPKIRLVNIQNGRNVPFTSEVRDRFMSSHTEATLSIVDTSHEAIGPKQDKYLRTDWRDYEGFRQAGIQFGEHRITGIRGTESSVRAMSLMVHGTATEKSCRPIIRWTGQDVWSYLALHNLPIHPIYAMTMGGAYERDRLRVGNIGGEIGDLTGREEHELRYFPQEYKDSKKRLHEDRIHYADE